MVVKTDAKLVCTDVTPLELVPEPCVEKSRIQKYEKKNIYYKAIFRDIRKYFIEMLNSSTNYVQLKKQYALKGKSKYKAFEPSVLHLVKSLISEDKESRQEREIHNMAAILAPFLNYNDYLIGFGHKRDREAQCILDCLQNFTLTKMRKVLEYPIIRLLVNHYFKKTVKEGTSERLRKHKTMKKNPQKYLEVLGKILDICVKAS